MIICSHSFRHLKPHNLFEKFSPIISNLIIYSLIIYNLFEFSLLKWLLQCKYVCPSFSVVIFFSDSPPISAYDFIGKLTVHLLQFFPLNLFFDLHGNIARLSKTQKCGKTQGYCFNFTISGKIVELLKIYIQYIFKGHISLFYMIHCSYG